MSKKKAGLYHIDRTGFLGLSETKPMFLTRTTDASRRVVVFG